jgi:hypothetical protein
MTLEQDIQALQKHESFARFLETIHSLREECISELHKANNERIQQLSGMILCYDQMLQMTGWNEMQLMHQDRLSRSL